MNAKQIKAAKIMILTMANADKVTYSPKAGTFTARRYYFYRHGMTSEKFAAKFAEIGEAVVDGDHFRLTRDGAYFWAEFTLKDADAVVAQADALAVECGMTFGALYQDMVTARS
jgi:hypothetical protein